MIHVALMVRSMKSTALSDYQHDVVWLMLASVLGEPAVSILMTSKLGVERVLKTGAHPHHKSHTTGSGLEPGVPGWEASDKLPELQHDQVAVHSGILVNMYETVQRRIPAGTKLLPI
jgi:hypothetical protein